MAHILNITSDSRRVQPGDTFVAIKGFTVDGHDYIEKAIENGATRIICEHGSYSVETTVVENSEKWLNEMLVENVSPQFSEMKFVGITGTNGKTTTAYLVSQMLNALGMKAAYIGTIGFYVGGELIRELPNTTPDVLAMYNLILESKSKGADTVIMEVSSHALYYGRINGIKFDVAAFTNLTEDHLDFHKTMEAYLETKVKLVDYIKDGGTMIVNADDPASEAFKAPVVKSIGLASEGNGADYLVKSYKYNIATTDMVIGCGDRDYELKTNLLNKFNLYNYTLAAAITNNLGYSMEDIIGITGDVYPPSGRNEIIEVEGAKAVIDYAHTPDAVEKIIEANLEDKTGQVITVIGCGGDRDPIKRPIMGEIATRLSDYVIFTDDNPRTEDHEKIMEDILKGVNTDNYEVVLDRAKAIRKGLKKLEPGDSLLILGKGHEDYQILGHEKVHFSDREQVIKYLKRRR